MEWTRVKLEVFVPEEYVDEVRQALAQEGAGVIGSYTQCSSAYPVHGTWQPGQGARPFEGVVGELQRGKEWKLEMVCEASLAGKAVAAVQKVHPYEEPVIYVLPLLDNLL